MLNGFSKEICFLCDKKLVKAIDDDYMYYTCGSEYFSQENHFSIGENEGLFEEIIIEKYVIIFKEKVFFICEINKPNSRKQICEISNANILYKDLNTVEKIEEFIRNYQIL